MLVSSSSRSRRGAGVADAGLVDDGLVTAGRDLGEDGAGGETPALPAGGGSELIGYRAQVDGADQVSGTVEGHGGVSADETRRTGDQYLAGWAHREPAWWARRLMREVVEWPSR